MQVSDFDFQYPEELIAQYPLPERDLSRMMVLDRTTGKILHKTFRNFPEFLQKGDVLVINDSRVFPARLIGRKETGGKIEILLLNGKSVWKCITNQTKTSKPGLKIKFGDELIGKIIGREGDELLIEFNKPELIKDVGLPPLPPYIRHARSHPPPIPPRRWKPFHLRGGMGEAGEGVVFYDKERYQTIYAQHTGSAAAPTAGFHFTAGLLAKIKDMGVVTAKVTLHVGLDTFSPVRAEDIEEHKMHGEEYFISGKSAEKIIAAKKEGRRIIAVGTTSVRALESFFNLPQHQRTNALTHQRTDLFITPSYKFHIVDAILTNFHQPKSSLVMLVSAFAGRESIMNAYSEAIRLKYRLFSYGDCMFIF